MMKGIKRFYFVMIILLSMNLVFAATINTNNDTEMNDTQIEKVDRVIAKAVTYPVITGYWKPSAHCNYNYVWHERAWISTCPFCGSHNLLDNPKGVPEGEITCGNCDADFCGVCGADKMYKARAYLTPA